MKHLIALRYAKALFSLDLHKNYVEQRAHDFTLFLTLLTTIPHFLTFLTAPHIKISDKKDLLESSCLSFFDSHFINLLYYLLEKRRIPELSSIANQYQLLVDRYFGRTTVEVITAVPLDHESKKRCKEKLEKELHKKIELITRSDPQIIGGVIYMVDHTLFDGSIRGKIKKLEKSLHDIQI